jgi:outer membrane protein assembly factor BamE (lipoprotein component of BamABCDE complex)
MKNQTLKGYFIVLFLLNIVFYGAINQPICFADDNAANELLKISPTPQRPAIDISLINKISKGMHYKQVMEICGNPHRTAVYGTNLTKRPKKVVFYYKTTQEDYAIYISINGYVLTEYNSIRKLKRKI